MNYADKGLDPIDMNPLMVAQPPEAHNSKPFIDVDVTQGANPGNWIVVKGSELESSI